jgi:plasmid stability protein
MAKKERKDRGKGPAGDRLRALLDAGDHRSAAAEARALLADAASGEAERAEAAAVLASLAPDRGVALAGAAGLACALALVAWTLLAS